MRKRALLIINRHARRGKSGFAQAVHCLDELGFELITIPLKLSQSLTEYVQLYANSVDMVIVGGGDGR